MRDANVRCQRRYIRLEKHVWVHVYHVWVRVHNVRVHVYHVLVHVHHVRVHVYHVWVHVYHVWVQNPARFIWHSLAHTHMHANGGRHLCVLSHMVLTETDMFMPHLVQPRELTPHRGPVRLEIHHPTVGRHRRPLPDLPLRAPSHPLE